MSEFLRTAGVVLLSTMLGLSTARATTLQALSTEELVQSASAIGVTQVVDAQVMRRGGRLTTLVTVEVLSPIKGLSEGQRLFVRIPGGVDGQWAQRVEGAPVMTPGDKSVVFLEPAGPSTYQVVGMEQGKLDVVRDANRWMVQRTVTAPRMIRGPNGQLVEAPAEPVREPLDAYLDRVRSAVQEHP